ncbi:MAG: hypothetical protein ACFCVK_09265 [Acidimicrobiales bacterium]
MAGWRVDYGQKHEAFHLGERGERGGGWVEVAVSSPEACPDSIAVAKMAAISSDT